MQKTKLMGILNITPDSFFDGNRYYSPEKAIERAKKIVSEGADIIDIGGESTRPGSIPVTLQEEKDRVIPIIQEISSQLSIPISIDTQKAEIAKEAIQAGAKLINDVSGFRDQSMIEVAASYDVQVCIMHMQGTPQTMQNNPTYEDGVTTALLRWFEAQVDLLIKAGVKEEQIILDPGIGFGKTIAHNREIIHNLPKLKAVGFPLLFGASRKMFMGKILHLPAKELLPTTLAVNTLAIQAGVDIIRVHDVQEHRKVIDFMDAMYK